MGAGVLTAAVIAWFHGERGRHKAPVLAHVLLGLILVARVAVSAVWAL